MTPISDPRAYLFIVFGIFVSLLLPVVRQLATPPTRDASGLQNWIANVWPVFRPYAFMGVLSFLSALVIFAGFKAKQLPIDSQWAAFLLGYFCDSTIQKLKPS